MYAAAGGASLASRQARQKQRQNKKQQALKNANLTPKPQQAKNFQNYTDPAVPRLSRVERGALRPPQPHERRHSTSNYHLKEPGRARIRESPSISIPVVPNHQPAPLTPCTLVQQHHHHHAHMHPAHSTATLHHPAQSQLPQIFIPEDSKLERRCSFVRQVEEMEKPQPGDVLDRCNHICNFEIKDKQWENQNFYTEYDRDPFGSLEYPFSECSQGRAAWQERERGRRCSLSEEARQHRIKQTEAHHRWMKRNRIHDASYGGDEEDFFDVYHQSAAANALLYVGLGAIAIGSIIFFVGTGEKGFKTLELRLIGPAMVSCGLLCCVVRILLCACPSTCLRRRKNPAGRGEDPAALYPLASKCRRESARDHRTMSTDYPPMGGDDKVLLHKQKKKVSIVPPNHSLPSTSTQEFKELPHVVATVTEDNVRKISIPQINLPDVEEAKTSREDSIIELQSLDLAYEIESVSSASSSSSGDDGTPTLEPTKKHARARQPANNGNNAGNGDDVETTTLSVVIERNDNSESSDDKKSEVGGSLAPPPPSGDRKTHSGIVLSPLQLGQ